jgi:hypothetical protein
MDDQTTRLNRIELKLDKVGDAIISLARMEERMITLFRRMDNYDQQQTVLEQRVVKVEVAHASSSASAGWSERIIWILIVAAFASLPFVSK